MPFIGTQVSLAAFYRFGVNRILDHLQEQAGVNVIRIHADDRVRSAEEFFSLEGEKPEFNLCGLPIDPGNYKDTVVRCQAYMGKIPAKERLNLITKLRRELDERGMRLFVRAIIGPDAKRDSFSAMLSQNEEGILTGRPCNQNPHYLGFLRGVAEDVFRTAPIRVDGYLHMYEMGSGIFGGGHVSETCFCRYCQERGAAEGIDVKRARESVREIKKRIREALSGERPFGFDAFYAMLYEFPEALAWDAMQWRGFHESIAMVKGIAGHCQPDSVTGVHVYHAVSWTPAEQAGYDPQVLGRYCDYIKPLFYHTFSGLRAGKAIERLQKIFLPGAPKPEAYAFFLRSLGMDPQVHPAWEDFRETGQFEAGDYVRAGMARYTGTGTGIGTVVSHPPLYANVGWEDEYQSSDVNGDRDPSQTQTYRAVRAAIEGGAAGIFMSRQFSPELAFGDGNVTPVTLQEASAGGTKTHADGDVGPRSLAAYRAALKDMGWI